MLNQCKSYLVEFNHFWWFSSFFGIYSCSVLSIFVFLISFGYCSSYHRFSTVGLFFWLTSYYIHHPQHSNRLFFSKYNSNFIIRKYAVWKPHFFCLPKIIEKQHVNLCRLTREIFLIWQICLKFVPHPHPILPYTPRSMMSLTQSMKFIMEHIPTYFLLRSQFFRYWLLKRQEKPYVYSSEPQGVRGRMRKYHYFPLYFPTLVWLASFQNSVLRTPNFCFTRDCMLSGAVLEMVDSKAWDATLWWSIWHAHITVYPINRIARSETEWNM